MPRSRRRRWRDGLAEWGQDGARIERLREAADFAIYTPGSRAGLAGVDRSAPLRRRRQLGRDDAELLAERAGSTATSLLSLAGVDAARRAAASTRSSATLLTTAWRRRARISTSPR